MRVSLASCNIIRHPLQLQFTKLCIETRLRNTHPQRVTCVRVRFAVAYGIFRRRIAVLNCGHSCQSLILNCQSTTQTQEASLLVRTDTIPPIIKGSICKTGLLAPRRVPPSVIWVTQVVPGVSVVEMMLVVSWEARSVSLPKLYHQQNYGMAMRCETAKEA